MSRYEFTHACPKEWSNGETCEAEVLLEYEAGSDPSDFQLIEDSPVCTKGHVATKKEIEAWWDEDFRELGEREQERAEEAYENHVNSLIDRRLGK